MFVNNGLIVVRNVLYNTYSWTKRPPSAFTPPRRRGLRTYANLVGPPVGVRDVDVIFGFFVVGTYKANLIYDELNSANLSYLAFSYSASILKFRAMENSN